MVKIAKASTEASTHLTKYPIVSACLSSPLRDGISVQPHRGGGGRSIHQGRDVDALGHPEFFTPNGPDVCGV